MKALGVYDELQGHDARKFTHLLCHVPLHGATKWFCVEWEEHSEVWITIDGECMHMI